MGDSEHEQDSFGEESSRDEPVADDHIWTFKIERTVASRYEVTGQLFHGSLGEVYRVKTDSSKTPHNMRWILGVGEGSIKALDGLTALSSRYVVNVLDYKALDGGAVVVTEPYRRTLRDLLRDEGKLSPETAGDRITLLLQALAALESMDIFPYVSPEAIAAWEDGIALDEYYLGRLYPRGAMPIPLDRAPYLPPDLDPRDSRPSDSLYGVGAVLHEMLTGTPHLSGPPFEVIARAMRQDYRIEIGGRLGELVQRLLAPTAAGRFHSTQEVLNALSDMQSFDPGQGDAPTMPVFGETLDGSVVTESAGGAAAPEKKGGPEVELAETNDQGRKVFVRRPDDVRMVLIPGGTFQMGSPRGADFNRKNELPVVEVTVGPFLIDETPTTWGELDGMLSRAGSSHPLVSDRKNMLPAAFGGDRDPGYSSRWYNYKDLFDKLEVGQPAVLISHEEASLLAELTGLQLPTEAQWEYAYRGGTTTEYYWGDSMEAEQAWFNDNTDDLPATVRQMPANPFGLFDMAGNVAEYCRDYYHKDVYKRVKGSDPDLEPLSAEQLAAGVTDSAKRFSLRGGSWDSSEKALRAAFRADVNADTHTLTCGFRFVIDGSDPPGWAKSIFESMD